jgi:Ankyrin repeats (many copies)
MLNITISGNLDALTLLIERGISCSNVIDDNTSYTLLHAAAAYGRHECAGMLIRHGYAATNLATNGDSAVDVAFASTLSDVLKRDNITRPEWSDGAATVLMLLTHGCDYNVSNIMHKDEYAEVVKQYYDELRDESVKQQQLLQQHAAGIYSVNDETSGVDSADTITVQVQLINAVTKEQSSTVYTLGSTLLAMLHALSADSNTSILMKLFVPPERWGVSNTTSDTIMRILSYDGK